MGARRTSGSPSTRYRFRATVEKSDNRLWGSHVTIPAKIARALSQGPSRRVLCSIDSSETFQRALVAYRPAQYVITVNKGLLRQLQITIGSIVNVTLQRDQSQYGLPMPAELSEALKQDPVGARLFLRLPAGKQRTLLYIVDRIKDPHRRAWRAIVVVRHLKDFQGRIVYKELSRALRRGTKGASTLG